MQRLWPDLEPTEARAAAAKSVDRVTTDLVRARSTVTAWSRVR